MFNIYTNELEPAEKEAISRIQEWVERGIGERDDLAASSPGVAPSTYWQYSARPSSYTRRMPPEEFSNIRLHTYFIDSSCCIPEVGFPPDHYQPSYDALRSGLPERYWIGAPQLCAESGHLIDGRLVNYKVVEWQRTVRNLWHNGELPRLEKIQRPVILEIGAGYGGIANHFMNIYPEAVYIIVDIPETLLFSASYLTLIHGQDRVHLLDQETPVASDSLNGGSFLMVPDFRLPSIFSLNFDLAINMFSFGEMTESQVTDYLEFLAPRTDVLYSKNPESFAFTTDPFAVTPLLRQYFDLRVVTPWPTKPPGNNSSKRILRALAGKVRRGIVAALYWPDRKEGRGLIGDGYLAVPKASSNSGPQPQGVPARSH